MSQHRAACALLGSCWQLCVPAVRASCVGADAQRWSAVHAPPHILHASRPPAGAQAAWMEGCFSKYHGCRARACSAHRVTSRSGWPRQPAIAPREAGRGARSAVWGAWRVHARISSAQWRICAAPAPEPRTQKALFCNFAFWTSSVTV
eukprot:7260173-Prymnesium_polylepis.1